MWVTSTGIYNIKVKTKKIFEYLFKKIKSLHIDIDYVRKTTFQKILVMETILHFCEPLYYQA